jgi:hypothetical protein
MAEMEGAVGRQFQSLSIVFLCAVNTKFTFWTQVLAPDIYRAQWSKACHTRNSWMTSSIMLQHVYWEFWGLILQRIFSQGAGEAKPMAYCNNLFTPVVHFHWKNSDYEFTQNCRRSREHDLRDVHPQRYISKYIRLGLQHFVSGNQPDKSLFTINFPWTSYKP